MSGIQTIPCGPPDFDSLDFPFGDEVELEVAAPARGEVLRRHVDAARAAYGDDAGPDSADWIDGYAQALADVEARGRR